MGSAVKDEVSDYYRKNALPRDNQLSLVLYLHKILDFKDNGAFLSQKLGQLIQKMTSPEVFIFNTNGMNYSNDFQIYDPFIANQVSNFRGKQRVNIDYMEFADKDINLVSFPAERMSIRKIVDILQALSFLEIDAVISHGENLFIQDAIYQIVPSIFATTGGVVPFAHSDAYWVPGNLLIATSKEIALKYGHADFMEESMLVTPEGRADEAADRSLFSLLDDAVIYLVVSTRMADEVESSFSDICSKLLRVHSKNNKKPTPEGPVLITP